MSSAARTRITPEEYLDRERRAEMRSEYHNGEMFLMAGASFAHNLIVHNLNRELGNQLRDRPCMVGGSDLRLALDAKGPFVYPDVVVVCGEPRFHDARFDTLLNPTVLIEVLSQSTEGYDRGLKFANYRELPSLREYVLVAQGRIMVERYTRQGDDWLYSALTGLGDILTLSSIDCAVPMPEIYAKVDFGRGESEGSVIGRDVAGGVSMHPGLSDHA